LGGAGRLRCQTLVSFFLGFGTALPEYAIDRQESQRALSAFWPRLPAAAAGEAVNRHAIAPLAEVVRGRSVGEAMCAYAEHAPKLARTAACQALRDARVHPADVDMVISVSCTGYLVPSLDVRLANEIGLRPDVLRLPITELGCAGGAAAIAAAHRHLLAFPNDRVLVVAVELCSLNFHPGDRSIDNLTAALVFGDGAAATVMTGRPAGAEAALEVVATGEWLLPHSMAALGFDLRESGFHVVLDRKLPRLIAAELGPIVKAFQARHRVPQPDFYAVHAGGPRIFDAVDQALALEPHLLAASRGVFSSVGNLSSASLLFGLAATPPDTSGDGLALAFGPGVTVGMAHLRRYRATPS